MEEEGFHTVVSTAVEVDSQGGTAVPETSGEGVLLGVLAAVVQEAYFAGVAIVHIVSLAQEGTGEPVRRPTVVAGRSVAFQIFGCIGTWLHLFDAVSWWSAPHHLLRLSHML